MGKTVFTLAALMFTATAALTVPASATDTATAIGACVARGPDCTIANKNGGYEICVNNTDGKQCVHCPDLGSSGSQTCTAAAITKGTGKTVTGVVNKGKSSAHP